MEQESSVGIVSELGTLGAQAVGSIAPDGDGSLSRAIRDILSQVYIPTTECVVASCIDGRDAAVTGDKATDSPSKAPDAAGGTLALWMAFVLNGCNLAFEPFLEALRKASIPIGGHTDDHEHIDASGCGANDRLGHILELISAGPSLARIVALTKELGAAVSEADVSRLAKRADELSGSDLLGTPTQRIALIEEYGDTVTLCGGHAEQLIVINTIPQTTLDRSGLRDRLGERAAAFNVDTWAFRESLRQAAAALDQEDLSFESLLAALLFYSLATALVLCGPTMPLVLR
jgi:hypothetical protein